MVATDSVDNRIAKRPCRLRTSRKHAVGIFENESHGLKRGVRGLIPGHQHVRASGRAFNRGGHHQSFAGRKLAFDILAVGVGEGHTQQKAPRVGNALGNRNNLSKVIHSLDERLNRLTQCLAVCVWRQAFDQPLDLRMRDRADEDVGFIDLLVRLPRVGEPLFRRAAVPLRDVHDRLSRQQILGHGSQTPGPILPVLRCGLARRSQGR